MPKHGVYEYHNFHIKKLSFSHQNRTIIYTFSEVFQPFITNFIRPIKCIILKQLIFLV